MLPYFSGETVTAIFNVFQGWPWKISLPETKQERGQSDGILRQHLSAKKLPKQRSKKWCYTVESAGAGLDWNSCCDMAFVEYV
ncbi:hypothetical protein TESG_08530 [Trichophyton tonsurans CBS 112818]|uniref:Uncharacterized protein n=1 Tax=Trichophyton tonsurans (strain CBS 112818) TaxID=647933 RepID=F2S3G3_TRIT1|nr:hypothetical protein TESG_08530 [Trichophyton tonsurans CBS 112818]